MSLITKLAAAVALSYPFAGGAVAHAEPPAPQAAPQEQFTCDHAGTPDRRVIGIYKPGGPQRCRVDYTRDGRTRSLWSSGHDYRFCVTKALEIVRLLESVSFTCAPHTEASGSDAGH